MPRPPLTEDALTATRKRILAETAKIIAAEGYGAFSMRRLAEAVGLTAGALYRYFPTKQQVLVAYWSEALDALHRRLLEIAGCGGKPVGVLHDMLVAYGEFAIQDRDRFRVLFLENDQGEMGFFTEEPHVLAAYELVRDHVAEAIHDKSLRPLPVDAATHILWGAVHGAVTLAITVKEVDFGNVRELIHLTAETALRGLSEPSMAK